MRTLQPCGKLAEGLKGTPAPASPGPLTGALCQNVSRDPGQPDHHQDPLLLHRGSHVATGLGSPLEGAATARAVNSKRHLP